MRRPVHPLLEYGQLDKILTYDSGTVPGALTAYNARYVTLKDGKKAVLLIDGGSSHIDPKYPDVVFTCRGIIKRPGADAVDLSAGNIIKAQGLRIVKLKTGEKILEIDNAHVVANYDCQGDITPSTTPHPLTLAPGRRPPVNPPQLAASPSPQAKQTEHHFLPPEPNRLPPSIVSPARQAHQRAPFNRQAEMNMADPAPQSVSPFDNGPNVRMPAEDPSAYYGAQRRAVPTAQYRAEPYKPVVRRPDKGFVKISDLSNYIGKWTIRGRVANKSDIKTFCNARGEGKLLSIVIRDQSGEIKGTFFNQGVDNFAEILEEGQIYTFTKGSIKPANVKFNTCNHKYEISFDADADIREAEDDPDEPEIPKFELAVQPLENLEIARPNDLMDLLAVVARLNPMGSVITRSTGQPLAKRVLQLLDQKGKSAELVVWGNRAQAFETPQDLNADELIWFVAVRKAKVSEWGGAKQLATHSDSVCEIFIWDKSRGAFCPNTSKLSPEDVPGLISLREWYMAEGKDVKVQAQPGIMGKSRDTRRYTVAEIIASAQNPDASAEVEKSGLYFSCVASISLFHVQPGRKYFWIACPGCNKKVTGGEDASELADAYSFGAAPKPPPEYYCHNCNKDVPKPDRKFVFQLDLQDYSETLRCSIMGDVGQVILGAPADEIEMARLNGKGPQGEDWMDFFNRQRRAEFLFRIQAKTETFQDESRIRFRIVSAESIASVAQQECVYKQRILTALLSQAA